MNVEAMIDRALKRWRAEKPTLYHVQTNAFAAGYRRGLEDGVAEGVCMNALQREKIRAGLVRQKEVEG